MEIRSVLAVVLVISATVTADYVRPPPRQTLHFPWSRKRSCQPEQVHISLAGDKHMRVSWVTNDKFSPSIVEYGTSPGRYSSVVQGESTSYSYLLYSSGKIHHTVIGPLEPSTVYFYRCGEQGPEFQLKTPPAQFPITFAVAGDLGQTGWTKSTLDHIDKCKYDVHLLPGDLSYADYMQHRWDTFGEFVEPLASARPWMVTEGNHEKEYIPLLTDGFESYNARWKMPFEESGSSSNLYYSFEVAGVHVIMLGSYTDYDKYSDQFSWLKADLSNVDREKTPWLIVLFHVPWYNSNEAHQHEGDEMMEIMEPLLHAASVDLVFAGHVHAYERTTRVNNGKSDPCGPIHITIGDGGNREGLARKYKDPQPEWSVFREASFGHGEFQIVNSTHALWTWHRNDDDEPVRSDNVWITSLKILTFLILEPDGNWRIVTLPLQFFNNTNYLLSGSPVNMDGLHLVSPASINSFKVDQGKTQKAPPSGATYSVKSFAARNFPASNVRHQAPSRTLANKMTILNEFSSNSSCQSSIICQSSSASIPKGSDAINSSDTDRTSKSSKEDTTVKRNTRKKGRKKGKKNKRHSRDCGPTEPEILSEGHTVGSSTSETFGSNDMDHGEGAVPCTRSPGDSLSDGGSNMNGFEGNSSVINCSDSTQKCASYVDGLDASDGIVYSMMQKVTQEHPVVTSDIDRSMEKTYCSVISSCDDMDLRAFSNTRGSMALDSVSVGSNSDNCGNASHDVKTFDNESNDTSLSEPPGFSTRKGYLSHRSMHGGVDEHDYAVETKLGGQSFSGNDVPVVASGKGVKQIKLIPPDSSVQKIGGYHGRTGKENTNVWQKVQRNDVTECKSELKTESSICSQFDVTLKDAALLKRNVNVAEINALSKKEDKKQSNNKGSKKSRRKTNSVSKQEHNSYTRRGAHSNKGTADTRGKISMQQNEKLTAPVNDQKNLSDVSETHSLVGCPRAGIQINRVKSMNSESVRNSQVYTDNLETLEGVSSAVSAINNKNIESEDGSSSKSCISLEKPNLLEEQSQIYPPHPLVNEVVQPEKPCSLAENSKQNHSSGSILQKWVPVGIKDPDSASPLRSASSSLEHSDGLAAEDWTSRSSTVVKVASTSQHLVSLQNGGIMCMDQRFENLNCSHEDDNQIQKLKSMNAYVFKENSDKHGETKCVISESNDCSISAVATHLSKIVRAVNDAWRAHLALEAVQVAIGGPIAPFERLLQLSSPVICHSSNLLNCNTCSRDQTGATLLCRHETPNISLGTLWQWYEKHGSYGLEVRAEDYGNCKRLGVDRFAFRAYYVPYLSAVQLFKNCKDPEKTKNRIPVSGVPESSENCETSKGTSNLCHLPIYSVLVPQPHTSDTSILLHGDEVCKPELHPVSAKERSSVQAVDMSADLELLFEYFESEQPQRRQPLYEKIEELVSCDAPSQFKMYGDPTNLNSINLHELHPGSWYSVAWYPIYRIPDGNLRAAFLTYHSLGHLALRSTKPDYPSTDANMALPVVGLQSYNAQDEYWFQLRHSPLSQRAENHGSNPSGILKERLRTLEETASVMARAVVNKGDQTSVNRHPDYEFFLSRRRY